ncbi:FecR family protein [Sphingobacterium lactis]|uniref:FecR family protein n=1 Tax=Sphingobacterium lactis TaxID=797291 RepID=UPI003F7F9A1A
MDLDKLNKLFNNKCSAEECEFLMAYYEANPEKLDQIKIFEDLSEKDLFQFNNAHLQQLYAHIQPKRKYIKIIKFISVAASLIGIVFGFLWLSPLFKSTKLDQNQLIISNYGKNILKEYLPDSSIVLLSPQSKLIIGSNYLANREINQLEGEITYEVKKNKKNPFSVIYQKTKTTALGTKFTIKEEKNSTILISLLHGSIAVTPNTFKSGIPIILKNNGKVRINLNTDSYNIIDSTASPIKTKLWTASLKKEISAIVKNGQVEWESTQINLHQVPNIQLTEVLRSIYGFSIKIEDKQIVMGNFTGSVKKEENISSFLSSFCQLNGCSFSIDQNMIYIKAK